MRKLVAVAINYRGRTLNAFVMCPICADGMIRISQSIINDMLTQLGWIPGTRATFMYG